MLPLRCYFVSDIHLSGKSDPHYPIFLKFLEETVLAQEGTHLFLVGDIFDLWIGDHQNFVDEYDSIIEALKELREDGVEIHYFEGNHDLYLEKFWRQRLGFHVYSQATHFSFAGLKLRVEHGDEIDRQDYGYLFLRGFLRSWPIRKIALNLSSKWVEKIGKKASTKSRNYTTVTKRQSDEVSIEKIREHAQSRARESEFDVLVSGHLHVDDDFKFEVEGRKCRSINLGTWLQKPSFWMFSEGKFARFHIG